MRGNRGGGFRVGRGGNRGGPRAPIDQNYPQTDYILCIITIYN